MWNSNIHWVRLIRLSDDCHSYNIQLKLQPSVKTALKPPNSPKLVLQTVRNVNAGEELLLWFSEDILTMMQMAFLTPNNIQGQKRYVCTICLAMYESPNPLKLHITLGCENQRISMLWEKLFHNLTFKQSNEKTLKDVKEFCFKLVPPKVQRQKFALDLTTPSDSDEQRPNSQPPRIEERTMELGNILYRPFSEPPTPTLSAFRPFRKSETACSERNTSQAPLSFIPNFVPTFKDFVHFSNSLALENSDEAHVESLVSSLGKSKDGHICIYCGKCYSRKYGLKIHIRTHTGYKPLKCKFCLRPFGDPSNLNKHVRLHAEGETPYRCEFCGKILVRRRDLERHLKSRHMNEIHPDSSVVEESQPDANSSDEDPLSTKS